MVNGGKVGKDSDLLYILYQAFDDITLHKLDEESKTVYNSFFDGEKHYLSEIKDDSQVGQILLEGLKQKYYEKYWFEGDTIAAFEREICTSDNKYFEFQYFSLSEEEKKEGNYKDYIDGVIIIRIPDSSYTIYPWKPRGEILIRHPVFYQEETGLWRL